MLHGARVSLSRHAKRPKRSNRCRNPARKSRNARGRATHLEVQFPLGTRALIQRARPRQRSTHRRSQLRVARPLRSIPNAAVAASAACVSSIANGPLFRAARRNDWFVKRLWRGRRRRRAVGRSRGRISRSRRRVSRSFSRSFGRSRFGRRRIFFHGRRLATGRDAESESRSGQSRHAQLELRHRYYPSSQRRGLPPTREATPCQGLTVLASVRGAWGHPNSHSAESLHQASAAAASDSSSCANDGCSGVGTEPRPISTETCAALPCKCATSTSRMIL